MRKSVGTNGAEASLGLFMIHLFVGKSVCFKDFRWQFAGIMDVAMQNPRGFINDT
jgi:hypothetical protein